MEKAFADKWLEGQAILVYKNTEDIRKELDEHIRMFLEDGGNIEQVGDTLVKNVEPHYGRQDIVKKARMRGSFAINSCKNRHTWKGEK